MDEGNVKIHEILNSFIFRIDGIMEKSPDRLDIQAQGNQLKLAVEHTRAHLNLGLSLTEEKLEQAAQDVLKQLKGDLGDYEKGKLALKIVVPSFISMSSIAYPFPHLITFSPQFIWPKTSSPLTVNCYGHFPLVDKKPILRFGSKNYSVNFQSLQKLSFLVDLPALFPNLGKNATPLASRMKAIIPWEEKRKVKQSLFSVLIKALPIYAGTICVTYQKKIPVAIPREIIVGIHACSERRCSKGHNWCGGCQRRVVTCIPLEPGETIIYHRSDVHWHHKKGEYISYEITEKGPSAVAFAPDGNARIDGAVIVTAQRIVDTVKNSQYTKGNLRWDEEHHLTDASLVSWTVTFQPFDSPNPLVYQSGKPLPNHRYLHVEGSATGILVKAIPPKELVG